MKEPIKDTPLTENRPDRSAEILGFERGEYPYATKLGKRVYEEEKAALQVELLKVQH